MTEGWEPWAEQLIPWARTPGLDSYWRVRDRFFELLPPPRTALEVGCGEGRVTRDLHARGYETTGLDAAPTLVRLAQEADTGGAYLVADAAALPFAEASFDVVVAYNSLMDFDDLPGAVREAARVLEPGGRLCASVTHPIADAGRFESREADAPFVISGSYLESSRFEGTFSRDDLTITFHGYVHPLQAYARAFEDAGLLLEALREPRVPDDEVERDPAEARWQRLPAFLHLRYVKP